MKLIQRISFTVTIFVSAFLLFQVQPLISKFILPWFGGSPSVWTTAMLFFQTTLCGGYLYAHLLTTRLKPQFQTITHLTLLALASLLAVLLVPDVSMKPIGDEQPAIKILILLASCVGIPYFCLATTGPLIQYWFSRSMPGASAYRLYALSNVGSLLALLTFPYVFEPNFELRTLGQMWMYGFWGFAVICAIAAWVARKSDWQIPSQPHSKVSAPLPATLTEIPSVFQLLRWIYLPAIASLAFISTTDHVSHDIAPEPRLWIATLSLYLVTFIICFDHPRWYQRRFVAAASLLCILALSGRHDIPKLFGISPDYSLAEMRWLHFIAMFLICFVSHGELYRSRPSNSRYLTKFYLMISIGGALGGLFVTLIATNFFPDYYEWSILLVMGTLLSISILRSEFPFLSSIGWKKVLLPSAALGLSALVLFWEDPLSQRNRGTDEYHSEIVYQARNFYGTVAVVEKKYFSTPELDRRSFFSGQIVHGMQLLKSDRQNWKTTYYSEGSGVGETLLYAGSIKPSLKVAVVGLGVGTLLNYARANDEYDLFDINPEVIGVARQWFSNLPNAKTQSTRIFTGDARLQLESLPKDRRYDVIVLDAFSGDSVPLHLLTREAFAIYEQHLSPDGFIVVHITNSYLNLYPVVKRQAEVLGLGYRNKQQPEDDDREILKNHYLVMTRDAEYLSRYPSYNRRFAADGTDLGDSDPDIPDVPVWSDSFSSIARIQLAD